MKIGIVALMLISGCMGEAHVADAAAGEPKPAPEPPPCVDTYHFAENRMGWAFTCNNDQRLEPIVGVGAFVCWCDEPASVLQ